MTATGGEDSLRARKKAKARAHIAATAARLFGERGYEQVSVADVAKAAEVAQQTVYNYFPTKRDLVFDREDELRETLSARIRDRAAEVAPARAIREDVLSLAAEAAGTPVGQLLGSVAHLAAISPEVRRWCLESTDQLGEALAVAIVDSTPGLSPSRAKLHGIGLAWLSQTVIDEAGRRISAGVPPARIARELRAILVTLLDDLEDSFPGARAGRA